MTDAPFKLPLRPTVYGGLGHIFDAADEVVAIAVVMTDGEPCAERLEQRADYIVRAVNAHASLLESCEDVLWGVDEYWADTEQGIATIREARAAIAAATAEETT